MSPGKVLGVGAVVREISRRRAFRHPTEHALRSWFCLVAYVVRPWLLRALRSLLVQLLHALTQSQPLASIVPWQTGNLLLEGLCPEAILVTHIDLDRIGQQLLFFC